MTKITKLVSDAIVDAAAPAAPAAAQKPYCLTVHGPTTLALQEVAAHIRNGYVPDINTAISIFGAAGTIEIALVLGSPDQAFIDRAAVTTADAIAMEQAKYKRDVEQAAARLVEQAAQAEKAAKRAAMIAEQRAALAALEASA